MWSVCAARGPVTHPGLLVDKHTGEESPALNVLSHTSCVVSRRLLRSTAPPPLPYLIYVLDCFFFKNVNNLCLIEVVVEITARRCWAGGGEDRLSGRWD